MRWKTARAHEGLPVPHRNRPPSLNSPSRTGGRSPESAFDSSKARRGLLLKPGWPQSVHQDRLRHGRPRGSGYPSPFYPARRSLSPCPHSRPNPRHYRAGALEGPEAFCLEAFRFIEGRTPRFR
jgi:hypothetical protein